MIFNTIFSKNCDLKRMQPNYDTRNGPVINAAKKALNTGNINYILIWIPEASENTLKNIFESAFCKHSTGKDLKDIATNTYLDTVKRIHRADMRIRYGTLVSAALDESPVILMAERAIETGKSDELMGFIPKALENDLRHRLFHIMKKKNYNVNNVEDGRGYVAAFIDFVIYLHHISASKPPKAEY